jgi:hypothetical protein
MILNVTVFVVRVLWRDFREELILNVTLLVVKVWVGDYREELILNVSVVYEVCLKCGRRKWKSLDN